MPQDTSLIETLWSEVESDSPASFMRFLEKLEEEQLVLQITKHPDIADAFVRMAGRQIVANEANAAWWLAHALLLSEARMVWNLLVDGVPSDLLESVNQIEFYADLCHEYPGSQHFRNCYARSLLSHPDSRISRQALLDCQEAGFIAQQLYPEGTGKAVHKKVRKRLRMQAVERLAAFSVEERDRIIQLVLDRYYLLTEHNIRCPIDCRIASPSHELILYHSESVWRRNLTSDTAGLWMQRLYGFDVPHGVELIQHLRREFRPSWPRTSDFDFQRSNRDPRVWARYLKDLISELKSHVDGWYGNWHFVDLSRSWFKASTSVLLSQVEDTRVLIAAARSINSRLPQVLQQQNQRSLDRADLLVAYLKEYFESDEQGPILDWIRENHPSFEQL